MTRLWLAIAGIAGIAMSGAFAADMPPGRYMPPPRAPAYVPFFSWSGFYAGFNAGYGFGHANWTDPTTQATTGNFSTNGAMIGATVGYNMQLGSAVVGIETDLDWSGVKGSTAVLCPTTCQTANNWLGTLRGRLGYAFDRFLPYFTAGLAYGGVKNEANGVGSTSNTRVGWTLGAGLEYAFVNNWSAKLEYLYVDLGRSSCDTICTGGFPPLDVTFKTSIVRGGVNYKF